MTPRPDTTPCQSKISLSLFVLVVIECIGLNLHEFGVLTVAKNVVVNGSNAGALSRNTTENICNRCSPWAHATQLEQWITLNLMNQQQVKMYLLQIIQMMMELINELRELNAARAQNDMDK